MGWLSPVIHFASLLDLHDLGLLVLAIAYGVAQGYVLPFWRKLRPQRRPRGVLTDSRKEQIKIFATYLNTIGAGFMVTGVVGPIATYLYGTTKETEHSATALAIEIFVLIVLSVGAHLAARRVLKRLDP